MNGNIKRWNSEINFQLKSFFSTICLVMNKMQMHKISKNGINRGKPRKNFSTKKWKKWNSEFIIGNINTSFAEK
jgi:hypothetical protein